MDGCQKTWREEEKERMTVPNRHIMKKIRKRTKRKQRREGRRVDDDNAKWKRQEKKQVKKGRKKSG